MTGDPIYLADDVRELQAEIDRLRAELDARAEAWMELRATAAAEVARLSAEAATLKADAAIGAVAREALDAGERNLIVGGRARAVWTSQSEPQP